jgi:hypothetical protein
VDFELDSWFGNNCHKRAQEVMSDPSSTSAEIIPFPVRRLPPATDSGQERLRRALAALDAAVAGQRDAVAAWRGALANLTMVVSGLGESMQRYRGSLDMLDSRVVRLHAQAVQLERTANTAMAGRLD